MVSRTFPATHPRKGEATGFIDKVATGEKRHTIRGNYKLWKHRIEQVKAGKAYLSLRYWTGKPYASKQTEFMRVYDANIQKIDIYNQQRTLA